MTKPAPLRTIEHGLRRALAILEADGAKAAIQDLLGVERSASLLHKCADPDNDRHHLQLRYAVALDVACQKAGQLPPLLEVHRYLVERHGGGQAPREPGEVSVLRPCSTSSRPWASCPRPCARACTWKARGASGSPTGNGTRSTRPWWPWTISPNRSST